jgi:hypothetical protein
MIANKPFVRMLLNLIVNQVQDLDSLFVKVVDMIPEWEKVQHKLLLEEQRLAAIVAKPVPVKTPILDCEGLPKVVPNDPI